jgi:two-component system CheB/CheR fusion protein
MFTKGNSMLPTTRGEQPLRVLLADRSEETRELFATLFLGLGHEVKTAATGTEALFWSPLFRPHAVFTAIHLPDQSGFELCAALRRMPETAQALIVAITGHKSPDSAALAREAGFDDYLVKPVKLDIILATMGAIAGCKETALPPSSGSH